jgi:hypothetical protein
VEDDVGNNGEAVRWERRGKRVLSSSDAATLIHALLWRSIQRHSAYSPLPTFPI